MPTPPKPFSMLAGEKKGHRTKAELAARKAAESATLTGVSIRERENVKRDPMAHAEFKRIRKLLKAIDKDDAIYENVINRYCLMSSEADGLYSDMRRADEQLATLDEWMRVGEIDSEDYAARVAVITATKGEACRMLERKRKMMLEIERECLMTVAAALRAIPKKPIEGEKDPMSKLLAERMRG